MKVLIDTGAMHSCVASNVAAKSSLTIEAYDNVVTSLNGTDHWMEGIIRFGPLQMGEWMSCCDLILMHLRYFKMIIRMDFLSNEDANYRESWGTERE